MKPTTIKEPSRIMQDYLRHERIEARTRKANQHNMLAKLSKAVVAALVLTVLAGVYSSVAATKEAQDSIVSAEFTQYMQLKGCTVPYSIYDVE